MNGGKTINEFNMQFTESGKQKYLNPKTLIIISVLGFLNLLKIHFMILLIDTIFINKFCTDTQYSTHTLTHTHTYHTHSQKMRNECKFSIECVLLITVMLYRMFPLNKIFLLPIAISVKIVILDIESVE